MRKKTPFFFLLCFLFYIPTFGSLNIDSLQQIPNALLQDMLLDFKAHSINPFDVSNVQFEISDPTPNQVQAWLEGDYQTLDNLMTNDSLATKQSFLENTEKAIGKARAVIAEVQQAGKFLQTLRGGDLISLPQGMKMDFGDSTSVIIGINRLILYPTYAKIEVFAELIHPNLSEPLYFGAPDVKFSKNGGISGNVALGLLGDYKTKILDDKIDLTFKSAKIDTNGDDFKVGQGTYASFSCDGLDSVSIDVVLGFDKKTIKSALPQDTSQVSASFFLSTDRGLTDILVEVDLDKPFYHVEKEDVIWTVSTAVFDFSETRTSDGLTFPVAEYDPSPEFAHINNWKGVYINYFSVQWNDKLMDTTQTRTFEVSGRDLVLDHNGFTGYVAIDGLMPIEEGEIDGWAISIDRLEVHVLTNTLAGIEFQGLLAVPLLNGNEEGEESEEEMLDYVANFDLNDRAYTFGVGFTEDKEFEVKMLKAKVTIESTSQLRISVLPDGFEVGADLTGTFKIENADMGNGSGLNVPEIGFEGLSVASRGPYIRNPGLWDFPDTLQCDFKAFKLNLHHIALAAGNEPTDVELLFSVDLNLAASEAVDISASGSFRVVGNIETNSQGKQNWKYERLRVDRIQVQADAEAFSINGHVIFFEEIPEYGSGFQGMVDLRIQSLNKDGDASSFRIAAVALFGSTDTPDTEGYRYFMVDTRAVFPGIPIGPIALHGIGGGVYHHMRQGDPDKNFEEVPDQLSASDYERNIADQLGETFSGAAYEPWEDVKFGLNLNLIIAASSNVEAFNANVTFNVQMNNRGGLDQIGINGLGNFMGKISWDGSPACEGVSVSLEMVYIFDAANDARNREKGFYANAHAFVNTKKFYGGNPISAVPARFVSDMIYNCGDDQTPIEEVIRYAGGLEMQFTENTWFMNIGTPTSRISIVTSMKVFEVNFSAYMDIGNKIPPFPGLPENVANLTNLGNLVQNEASRGSGQGFAFGVAFDASLADINWTIFQASLGIGAGFDIMIQKYTDVYCANYDNEALGINNWYAAGQAWAYVEGLIKIAGVEILNVAVAAAIQMKGPNPNFGRGAVAGRYRVMGGLLQGNCHFRFEFGEECETIDGTTPLVELSIIASTTPYEADQSTGTDARPSIAFTKPIGVQMLVSPEMPDKFVIPELQSFKLKKNGTEVPGELVWSNDYFVEFIPTDMLDGLTEYEIVIEVSYTETETGIVMQAFQENKNFTFTTGPALQGIPETNVAHAYPGNGQFNYYPFQTGTNENYISLLQGQDNLFENIPDSIFQRIKITTTGNVAPIYIEVDYNSDENNLNYSLPQNLTLGKSYRLQLINGPEIVNPIVEENEIPVRTSSPPLQVAGSDLRGGGGIVTDETIPANNSSGPSGENIAPTAPTLPELQEGEVILYTSYFRLSKYVNFNQKINSMTLSNLEDENNVFSGGGEEGSEVGGFSYLPSSEYIPSANISGLNEPFGVEELIGLHQSEPTLNLIADLENTNWMENYTNLNIDGVGVVDFYQDNFGINLPCNPTEFLREDRVKVFGLLPEKAVYIDQANVLDCKVNYENIFAFNARQEQGLSAVEMEEIKIRYMVPNYIKKDIDHISTQIDLTLIDWDDFQDNLAPTKRAKCCNVQLSPNNTRDFCNCQLVSNNDNLICDNYACCTQVDEFFEATLDLVQNYYLNDFPACARIFRYVDENRENFCRNGFLVRRDLFVEMEVGNYPTTVNYIFPGQEVSEASINLNLQRE